MNITYLICKKCEDFVFSFNRHNMSWCKCGNCALDWGYDYHKITGNSDTRILCTEKISDCIDKIREKFEWTQRYDKNDIKLKKPVISKLKKLKTDHIVGILLYFTNKLIINDGSPDTIFSSI